MLTGFGYTSTVKIVNYFEMIVVHLAENVVQNLPLDNNFILICYFTSSIVIVSLTSTPDQPTLG